MQQPPNNPDFPYPQPPCYYKLFTDTARDDPTHTNHFVFTPPPPLTTVIPNPVEGSEMYSLNQPPIFEDRVLLYSIPPHIPQSYRQPTTGYLIRFHNDVDFRGELIKLNKLLAQSYAHLLQPLSSPQPPTPSDRGYFWDHISNISIIMSNISNLLALLREHQARAQLLQHLQKQTRLNREKIAKLNALADKASSLLANDFDPAIQDEIMNTQNQPK